MKNLFRIAFGGGGKRRRIRDIVREAAKQLRSEAAKVGRHCYADSETKVVSEIKDDRTIRRKDDKSETEAICRHSERLAKESSLLQYKAVAKNENNSSETDHASMPLGIFASKSVSRKINVGGVGTPPYGAKLTIKSVSLSDWQIRPTSKNLAAFLPSCLAAKKSAFTLAEGATHVAHCDKSRRVAFTLAEVLITLGIIGVVAALTLPTLIEKHQKKVTAKKLAVTYSIVANAFERAKSDYGDMSSWEVKKDGSNDEISEAYIDKYFLPYFDNYKKIGWGAFYWYYNNPTYGGQGGYFVEFKNGVTLTFAFGGNRDKDGNLFFNTPYFHVDINGKSKPNLVGKDRFKFMISDEKVVSGNYINLPNSIVVEACRNREADACTELIFRNGWEFPDDYPW